tara:strand:+ start:11987 stop:14338 length:2352 start_codon:yes stop_codon:yes gene_type:complete
MGRRLFDMEIFIYIVLIIITVALAKVPSPPAASLEDYQVPTVDPSRDRPVLFGQGLIQDPNTVWYGDEDSRKNGDWRDYYLGLHTTWLYSSSKFDLALTRILYGEKTAWTGNVTSNTTIFINKKELFGGREREGGIRGYVDVMFGGETQAKNSYLVSKQGSLNSAYRGMTSFVWRQIFFASNSPYMKQPWSLWKSIPNHWYSEKAEINGQCNPAHIIHACLTDVDFGLGLPAGDLNDANFRTIADTLFDEGMAASFQWSRQSSINEFLQQVVDHMGGTLDVNPLTGQYELWLIRSNYVVASLPLFDESNISSMVKYDGADYTSLRNEIVVKYIDKENGLSKSLSLQNAAAIAANGGTINNHSISYFGVVSDEQAVLLATRDLQALSAPLHKLEILVDRSAWQLRRGEVFRHSWAKHDVVSQVYRIGEIVKDTGKEGKIRIIAVEDVFGLPLATYTSGGGSLYVPPSTDAEDLTKVVLREATYYENQHRLAGYEIAELGANFGVPSVLVAKEKSLDVEYDIAVSPNGINHVVTAIGDFAPYAETATAVLQSEASIIISCVAVDRLDLVELNTWAQMGDEIVEVTAVDLLLNTITVNRGVLDTHPKAHLINTPIYFADGLTGRDPTAHSSGATVWVKLLPSTYEDKLDLASATNRNLVLNNRHERPYPPGAIRMNGAYFPVSITGQLSVTWLYRDRTQQLTGFKAWTAASVGPEVGTTYTLQIYGDGGGLKHTETGLTGTNYIYPTATEEAENGGGVNSSLRIVLWSVRDGWDSTEKFDFSFTRV